MLDWTSFVRALDLSALLPEGLDLLLQDELCHPSLIRFNGPRGGRPYPVVTVVHQVLCDEPRAAWPNCGSAPGSVTG